MDSDATYEQVEEIENEVEPWLKFIELNCGDEVGEYAGSLLIAAERAASAARLDDAVALYELGRRLALDMDDDERWLQDDVVARGHAEEYDALPKLERD